MNTDQTINLYQQIANISELMLNQAQTKNWPDLLLSGEKYLNLVKQVQKQAISTHKIDQQQLLLTKILNNESAVRAIIKPELANLSQLMDLGKNRRTAIKAYYDTSKPDIN